MNQDRVKLLAEWIIDVCGVEGIRNNAGKWQRLNDSDKLQARLEKRLESYLKETCTSVSEAA